MLLICFCYIWNVLQDFSYGLDISISILINKYRKNNFKF